MSYNFTFNYRTCKIFIHTFEIFPKFLIKNNYKKLSFPQSYYIMDFGINFKVPHYYFFQQKNSYIKRLTFFIPKKTNKIPKFIH
jgi:hypothetical protein